MVTYSRVEAAERSGASVEEVALLVELGIVVPDGDDRFSPGQVRRIQLAQGLSAAGIPLLAGESSAPVTDTRPASDWMRRS